MRRVLWGLVFFVLLCLVGFPSELGIDIEPMKKSPWVFSFYTVTDMVTGPPVDELKNLPPHFRPKTLKPPHLPLSISHRIITVAIFFATSVLIASLIWQIDRLFKAYSAGKVFTVETAKYFRSIGWFLVALFPVNSISNYFIEQIVLPLKRPFHKGPPDNLYDVMPPDMEWTAIQYISLDFPLLLAGLFMVVVAYVMQLGVQIQADVDATI
ncbi:DUF2975 domain-containing protein [Agarivorans sp. TSD2052]|uniref:DUF2975 domain-containing protein n=1 Tax=Agarivorans sp. TSD2052 TaxID=2937286 RepID=UPI00200D27C6|nr:DUF2975 domain-containing protein [Agarivorans sp. TSD2052]UPW19976.1 DUF2975 domain-containing protein [Agarivorans sp. TSD2052]